jgi:hypothetical protein
MKAERERGGCGRLVEGEERGGGATGSVAWSIERERGRGTKERSETTTTNKALLWTRFRSLFRQRDEHLSDRPDSESKVDENGARLQTKKQGKQGNAPPSARLPQLN